MRIERWLFDETRYCSQETGGFGAEAPPASIGGGPLVPGAGGIAGGGGGEPFAFTIPGVGQVAQVVPAPVGSLQEFATQVVTPAFIAQENPALILASDMPNGGRAQQLTFPDTSTIRSPEDDFRAALEQRGVPPALFRPIPVTVPQLFTIVMQPERFVVGSIDDFVRSFRGPMLRQQVRPGPEPGSGILRPLERQPSGERPPLIIPNPQGCTTCGEDFSRLEQQRGEVQREIQAEESQERQQRIEQQQREIESHVQEEQRPIATRDIQTELQSKYALLSQIQSEIEQIQRGGTGTSIEAQTSIVGHPSAPLINRPPPPQVFVQKEQPESLPNPAGAVKFCVYCSSQAESLKFLNGEPSECSVVP